jgi:hypothetical protein
MKTRVSSMRQARGVKGVILCDAITGLPVLTAGPSAPKLTSKHVRNLLSIFSEMSSLPVHSKAGHVRIKP